MVEGVAEGAVVDVGGSDGLAVGEVFEENEAASLGGSRVSVVQGLQQTFQVESAAYCEGGVFEGFIVLADTEKAPPGGDCTERT